MAALPGEKLSEDHDQGQSFSRAYSLSIAQSVAKTWSTREPLASCNIGKISAAMEKYVEYESDGNTLHKLSEILEQHEHDLDSELRDKQVAQFYSSVMSNEVVLSFEEHILSNVQTGDPQQLAMLVVRLRSILVLEAWRIASLILSEPEPNYCDGTKSMPASVEPSSRAKILRHLHSPSIVIPDIKALISGTSAQQVTSKDPRQQRASRIAASQDPSNHGSSYQCKEKELSRAAGSSLDSVWPSEIKQESFGAPLERHRRSSSLLKSIFVGDSEDGWRSSPTNNDSGGGFQRQRGRSCFQSTTSTEEVTVRRRDSKRGAKRRPISVDTDTYCEDRRRKSKSDLSNRWRNSIHAIATASALTISMLGVNNDAKE